MSKIKSKEQRRKRLERLIEKHGSAFAAARYLDISPSAFYERMQRADMIPKGYELLPGEPDSMRAKKRWLIALLSKHDNNVCAVARELKRSPTAIRDRMKAYKINLKLPNFSQRKKAFKKVFSKCGENAEKMAKELQITKQAVYERINRYGLQTPRQKVRIKNKITYLTSMKEKIEEELMELVVK